MLIWNLSESKHQARFYERIGCLIQFLHWKHAGYLLKIAQLFCDCALLRWNLTIEFISSILHLATFSQNSRNNLLDICLNVLRYIRCVVERAGMHVWWRTFNPILCVCHLRRVWIYLKYSWCRYCKRKTELHVWCWNWKKFSRLVTLAAEWALNGNLENK